MAGGNYPQAAAGSDARLSRILGRERTGDHAPRSSTEFDRPPLGAGPVAHAARSSADRAGDGQSPVAVSFRPGHRRHAERFRRDGRQPIASGTARLAGRRIRRQRLASEADASADGAVGHVLPVVASRSRHRRALPPRWPPTPPTICCGTPAANAWKAKRSATRCCKFPASLNLRMFGPSAQPELPPVLADSRYGWDPDARMPRIATAVRSTCSPSATCGCRCCEAFDQPDMHNSCPRRTTTTTAPQALELLNGESTDQAARAVERQTAWPTAATTKPSWCARRMPKRSAGRRRTTKSRPPNEFIDQQAAADRGRIDAASSTNSICPFPCRRKLDRAKAAAVVDFCHAMLCSNEFLYVD